MFPAPANASMFGKRSFFLLKDLWRGKKGTLATQTTNAEKLCHQTISGWFHRSVSGFVALA